MCDGMLSDLHSLKHKESTQVYFVEKGTKLPMSILNKSTYNKKKLEYYKERQQQIQLKNNKNIIRGSVNK